MAQWNEAVARQVAPVLALKADALVESRERIVAAEAGRRSTASRNSTRPTRT